MGLFNRKEKCNSPQYSTITNFEVHLKYWEFVISRLVENITHQVCNTITKARKFL